MICASILFYFLLLYFIIYFWNIFRYMKNLHIHIKLLCFINFWSFNTSPLFHSFSSLIDHSVCVVDLDELVYVLVRCSGFDFDISVRILLPCMYHHLLSNHHQIIQTHSKSHPNHSRTVKTTDLTGLVNVANVIFHELFMGLQWDPPLLQLSDFFHELVLFFLLRGLVLMEKVLPLLLLFFN